MSQQEQTKAIAEDANEGTATRAEDLEENESKPKPVRSQMFCELHRVRNEMTESRKFVHRKLLKPYTPDVFNDLSPYYNKFIVNYMINDQEDYVPRPGYGQRATSLGIVDPDVSWRMDHFPGPVKDSILPSVFYKPRIWSKNCSTNKSRGSTRLPPIPKVSYPRFKEKQYQHFNMDYSQVKTFRTAVHDVHDKMSEQRTNADYTRTIKDWNRMNLSELKQLPGQSKLYVKEAIMSYMGTTRGASKALKPLLTEIETPQQESLKHNSIASSKPQL